MKIHDQRIYSEADAILKKAYGSNARFREGQYEAIEATMTNRRTLVVQKTGWGKSLVYFICTKLFRNRGRGMTMVISPLLVLMENQTEMAERMGIRCTSLNSNVATKDRPQILGQMAQDQYDLVFITPENLFKDDVQAILPKLRLGLFVIDEAHCISDWGHDFRLKYGKLGRVVDGMPTHVAVLATTATANDRVVNDLQKQLGDKVFVSRGPLTRESLHIQVLRLEHRAERYAWLLDNLSKLPGTGIIYCLDRRDCEYLSGFLNENGIPAMSYYSKDTKEDKKTNTKALEAFQNNQIKAIVATIKLGMGYDKGDIGFVVHFQSPPGIVAWYQQIGRAGRNLKDAYVFLMSGAEDKKINEYFIDTAFPSRKEVETVIRLIDESNGITQKGITSKVNMGIGRAKKALYFMENEGFIRYDNANREYYPTPKHFVYNEPHYTAIQETRRREMRQMQSLIETRECLSRFAVRCLDDHTAGNCGKCANCTGKDILPGLRMTEASREKASKYINSRRLDIEPRKQWPNGKKIEHLLQPGTCLSKYGAPGFGELVASGKYPEDRTKPRFQDCLVTESANTLAPLVREKGITHISYVPSLRSNLVRDFTERLAAKMKLQFVELLDKSQAPQQKSMQNSAFQCSNAMNSFTAKAVSVPRKVILVDDIVDSRWTLTVCGYKIMERGCEEVYPYALASSSHEEE